MLLDINKETCIKCGKCVKVCPAWIFIQQETNTPVEVTHPDTCIICGHCVAVCPTKSVNHFFFHDNKVHPIDYTQMPKPEQVMLLCKARRSNRAFSTQPIPKEYIAQILEAAHRAPTASNKQEVHYTVITDPEMLKMISDTTIRTFTSVLKLLKNPLLKPILKFFVKELYKLIPSFERLQQAHVAGDDLILRKATAVIFIHTPEKNRFGEADANLAYQNGSLMAESLGVAQFYTGFVVSGIKQDKKKKIAKKLGITGSIHAGMALGMPMFRYPNYIDKKELTADFIEAK